MAKGCALTKRAWEAELQGIYTPVLPGVLYDIVDACPTLYLETSLSPLSRNVGHHNSLLNPTNLIHISANNVAQGIHRTKLETTSPYVCGRPGAVTPSLTNIGGCNWNFEASIARAYPMNVKEAALKQFRYVSLEAASTSCTINKECKIVGEVCGTAFKPGVALNLQIEVGKCGKLLGYWSANQICSVTVGKFPRNTFIDCINLQLYKCAPAIESCYNTVTATTSCCGCSDWKQDKNIDVGSGVDSRGKPFTELCVSKNPTWQINVLPSLTWLKSACPSAYTYPFDDMSSTFICATDLSLQAANTVSYLVVFCPNSAFTANNLTKVAGNRVMRFYNNCAEDVWPAMAGGAGKNIASLLSDVKTSCVSDSDCYSGTKCITRSGKKDCFWENPEPQGGSYKLVNGREIDFYIPVIHDSNDILWSGIITARKGCNNDPLVKICDVADCRGATATSNFKCFPGVGFSQPATQFEITMQKNHVDFYDIEIINGASIPIEVYPIQ